MSFLSPQTIAVLTVGALVRKLDEGIPLYERVLNGLRFYKSVNKSDIDVLIAPAEPGHVIKDEDRKERIFEVLENDALKGTFVYSYLPTPNARNIPWDHLVSRDAFARLMVLAVFSIVSYFAVSTIECLRGLEPGMAAVPVLFAVFVSVIYSLKERMSEVGRNRMESKIAIITGTIATVISSLLMLSTYETSSEKPAVAGTVTGTMLTEDDVLQNIYATTVSGSFIDLGASLHDGLSTVIHRTSAAVSYIQSSVIGMNSTSPSTSAIPSEPAKISLFIWVLGISSILGFITALLFPIMLRVSKSYADLTYKKNFSRNPLIILLSFLWFYLPGVIALLWIRPLTGDRLIRRTTQLCYESDFSRDCFVDPNGNAIPSYLVRSSIPAVPEDTPYLSKIWAYIVNLFYTPYGYTESEIFQFKIFLIVLYAGIHLLFVRRMMAISLTNARDEQTLAIMTAAIDAPGVEKNDRTNPAYNTGQLNRISGYSEATLNVITDICKNESFKSVVGVTAVGFQLLAVPLLFGSLALIASRLGNAPSNNPAFSPLESLPSFGICRAIAGPATLLGPFNPFVIFKSVKAPTDIFSVLLQKLNGADAASSFATIRDSLKVLTPAFWRPVLSFSMFFLISVSFLVQELGFVYFRFAAPVVQQENTQKQLLNATDYKGRPIQSTYTRNNNILAGRNQDDDGNAPVAATRAERRAQAKQNKKDKKNN